MAGGRASCNRSRHQPCHHINATTQPPVEGRHKTDTGGSSLILAQRHTGQLRCWAAHTHTHTHKGGICARASLRNANSCWTHTPWLSSACQAARSAGHPKAGSRSRCTLPMKGPSTRANTVAWRRRPLTGPMKSSPTGEAPAHALASASRTDTPRKKVPGLQRQTNARARAA